MWLKKRHLAVFLPWYLFMSSCYISRQAIHQNDLFNSRRLIEDVIEDPTTSEGVRLRLKLINEIVNFAEERGLKAAGAYRFLIDNQSRAVSFILQAAHSDRLRSITWWFPVVGRVPYLGFFSREDRDFVANDLAMRGFDVDVGEAAGFSSLGWFSDPVFSSMLKRNSADLVHLILHELVHRTVWFVDAASFNEHLAEFVSEILADEFIKDKLSAAEFAKYREKRQDRRLFSRWLRDLKFALEHLYKMRSKLTLSELLSKKQAIIASFKHPPRRPLFKHFDYIKSGEPWNNASILGSMLYAADFNWFAELRRCLDPEGTVASFLTALQQQVNNFHDGLKINQSLDDVCSQAYIYKAKM